MTLGLLFAIVIVDKFPTIRIALPDFFPFICNKSITAQDYSVIQGLSWSCDDVNKKTGSVCRKVKSRISLCNFICQRFTSLIVLSTRRVFDANDAKVCGNYSHSRLYMKLALSDHRPQDWMLKWARKLVYCWI